LRAFKIEDTEQRTEDTAQRENNSERDMGKGVCDCMHLKLKILSREGIIVRETQARECVIACI